MSGQDQSEPHITYEDVGGFTLRVAVWEGGNERPLLFFNGIGANLELITPLGRAFRDRDVITFDMPGIGDSPAPLLPYRPWQMARAAAKLLEKLGHDIVDVMGVSWGGAMAQQFAFQYKKRVGKLVLAATSAGMIMVPGHPSALVKMASPRRYMDAEYMMENFKKLYGEEADGVGGGVGGFANSLRAPTLRGYFYQMIAMAGWTSVPFLPFLPQKTLIMMGDRDRIVPVANGHFLKSLIPHSQLHIIKDGGHLFAVSRIDETMVAMEAFLAEDDKSSEETIAA